MMVDPTIQVEFRRRDLLVEADRERLAAEARQSRPPLRRELAVACLRLADWLDDDPKRYLQPSESGRAGWARIG
jgi:hypothetical protein